MALDAARAKHPSIWDKWISANTLYKVVDPLVIIPDGKTLKFNQSNKAVSAHPELSDIKNFKNETGYFMFVHNKDEVRVRASDCRMVNYCPKQQSRCRALENDTSFF